MEDQHLNKLERMKALVSEGAPTQEELSAAFSAIIKAFKESVSAMEETVSESERKGMQRMHELTVRGQELLDKWNHLSEMEKREKQVEEKCMSMMSMMEGKMGEMSSLYSRLESIKPEDLARSASKMVEKKVVASLPNILKTELPKEAKNLQSVLQEEGWLGQSSVKGLETALKELNRKIDIKTSGPNRRVFQPYRDDLSSSCDGNNKTFYLSRSPLRDNMLMVFGTDFPGILRPDIDFTIANKTLTLTASVPAPSQGATLLATYFA